MINLRSRKILNYLTPMSSVLTKRFIGFIGLFKLILKLGPSMIVSIIPFVSMILSWATAQERIAINPMDLTNGFSQPVQVKNGELVHLYGQVRGTDGALLPGVRVEIWQTDAEGYYDHPQSGGSDKRDKNFQFYGTAEVDGEGWYVFRTILPGKYFPRPRHIHFKVKQGSKTFLISQFYFDQEVMKANQVSDLTKADQKRDGNNLQLVSYQGKVWVRGDIYIDNGGRKFPATDSDSEGPYYPLVDVGKYDNDLVD